MADIKLDISVKSIIADFLKTIFWKNEDIIYLNSNKKFANYNDIKKYVQKSANKLIVESNTKLGYKHYSSHLKKMKVALYHIQRNVKQIDSFSYYGFCSTMFAAYDGYVLGDTLKNYKLFSQNDSGKSYCVKYHKKKSISFDYGKIIDKEISLVIETTQGLSVSSEKCKNDTIVRFSEKNDEVINETFLNRVFWFVRGFMDKCSKNGVDRVNLYIAAKQPIAFVVGLAINSYHPSIISYDFIDGKYCFPFDLKNGKMIKGE